MTWLFLAIIVIMIFWRKKKEIISNNDEFCVKAKKEMWIVRVMLIPYIQKKGQ